MLVATLMGLAFLGSAYAGTDDHFCKTVSGPDTNVLCHFPFVYKGVKYDGCTTRDVTTYRPWCATSTTNGEFNGQWGYCAKDKDCRDACRDTDLMQACEDWTEWCGDIGGHGDYVTEHCKKTCGGDVCQNILPVPTTVAPPTTPRKTLPPPTKKPECMTVDDPALKCKFPFVYKGIKYDGCTVNGRKVGLWCATHTDAAGNYIGKWGKCAPGCKEACRDDDPFGEAQCRDWDIWCDADGTKNGDYVRKWCKKTCGLCEGVPRPPTNPPTQPPPPPTRRPTQGPYTGPTPAPVPCGQPQVMMSRVIAGDNAKRGAWPWQILLQRSGRAMCGGSLINSRWVVTAAHCIDGYERYPHAFTVRVGEHDRKKTEGSEVDIEVEEVVKHESYNRYRLNNDIALLKLRKPVWFNKYVQPVCLPSADVKPGHECYITGWGKIKHPGRMHSYLQQARMPVVSNKVCHAKNYPAIKIPVTEAMICGGDGGLTRISGCHGDSGGPFVCKVNDRWELHGDVSHGSGRCSSKDTYTVFARTHHFLTWIKEKMQKFA